jgi:hypothetical protein
MSKDNTQEQDVAEEKDFQDFMGGYHRDIRVTGALLSSLVKAMEAHPTLRLGQLLYAVAAKGVPNKEFLPTEFMAKIADSLFNIYDEELAKRLEAFANE